MPTLIKAVTFHIIFLMCFYAQAIAQSNHYIDAISDGNIKLAEDIRTISGFDVNNIDGHPIAYYINHNWNLPIASYKYIYGDLHQDPNLVGIDGLSPLASLCRGALGLNDSIQILRKLKPEFDRFQERASYLIGAGASPVYAGPKSKRGTYNSVVSMCIGLYNVFSNETEYEAQLIKLIKWIFENGVDPNEAYSTGYIGTFTSPLFETARKYRTNLLSVIASYKDVSVSKNITFSTNKCGAEKTSRTVGVLAFLPEPSDADVNKAREYLTTFIKLGGDITLPQWYGISAYNQCIDKKITLKERALKFGQIEYAKMVQSLEHISSHVDDEKQNSEILPKESMITDNSSWNTDYENVATLNVSNDSNDHMKGEFLKFECDKDAESGVGLVVFFMGAQQYDGKWVAVNVISDAGQSFSVPTFCGEDEGGAACWLKLTKDSLASLASSTVFTVQMGEAKLVTATIAPPVKSVIAACTGSLNTKNHTSLGSPGWQVVEGKSGKVATFANINPGFDFHISCAGAKALSYQFDGHGKAVSSVTMPNANGDVVLKPDRSGYLSNKDATRFVEEIGNLIAEVKSYGNFNPASFSTPIFVNGSYGAANPVLGDITKVRETVRSTCRAVPTQPPEGAGVRADSCADKLHAFFKQASTQFMNGVRPSVSDGYIARFCAYTPAFIVGSFAGEGEILR